MDGTTLSAAVKGRLRAQGDKLLKKLAAEKKSAAASAAQSGVSEDAQDDPPGFYFRGWEGKGRGGEGVGCKYHA